MTGNFAELKISRLRFSA